MPSLFCSAFSLSSMISKTCFDFLRELACGLHSGLDFDIG